MARAARLCALAIALVGVDQAPDDQLIAKIRALPHVKEARALGF